MVRHRGYCRRFLGLVALVVPSLVLFSSCAKNSLVDTTESIFPADASVVTSRPTRHLSRAEYVNTIKRLIPLDYGEQVLRSLRDALPADDVAGAFDAGLTLSADHMRRYQLVAAEVAELALASANTLTQCSVLSVDCLRAWLPGFMRRAYRKEPTKAEIELALSSLDAMSTEASPEDTFFSLLVGILSAPQFLYHLEGTQDDGNGDGIVPLDSYAMASRISYFVCADMPDDELLDAARSRGLLTVEAIRSHVSRLLESECGRGGMREFYRQWFRIDELATKEKDAEAFPNYTPELALSMERSVERFIEHVLYNGLPVGSLYSSTFAYVDARLAPYFDTAPPSSNDFTFLEAPAPLKRTGLLSQPGMIAMLSKPARKSITATGAFILRNVLCQELGDPPDDAPLEVDQANEDLSERDRYILSGAAPSCMNCHVRTDLTGAAALNYRPDGSWHVESDFGPIDASGELANTSDINGGFANMAELSAKLGNSEDVTRCAIRQAYRYASSNLDSSQEVPAFNSIRASLDERDNSFMSIIRLVTESDLFRFTRIETEGN